MINIYQPSLGKQELKAIKKVFKSNWLGKGPLTEKFNLKIANKLNIKRNHIETISSCTEGLFTSMKLLGVKKGDEVILPSIHFIGAINAILECGATPVFCDVNPRTLNIEDQYVKTKITSKTKALILLHYAGVPCDMDPIISLCKNFNIKLIEDTANSPFSTYKGKNTGTMGDIGLWSFDAMKQLVMGDGGLIFCKNSKLIQDLKQESYLGLISKSGFSNPNDKWWEFNVDRPGRRSITNDIQAAMGIEQLKKIDKQLEIRKKFHDMYSYKLQSYVDVPLPLDPDKTSSYYMYHIQTPDRDKLASFLKKKGIYTTFRYYPLHKVKYFKQYSTNLPNTEYITKNTICIPLHQSLTKKQANYICETIKKFNK
jgi:dTDP-4-amino-4,6-dideoxygalactose transaminase